MRQQLIDFTRPLRRQARENVFQICIGIMTIDPRRLDQAHDRRRPFAAAQFLLKPNASRSTGTRQTISNANFTLGVVLIASLLLGYPEHHGTVAGREPNR